MIFIIRKSFFHFIILAIIIFLSPIKVYADNHSIRFNNITVEEGLSQGSVFEILQDNKGYLWFGTYDGLNKYDGYEFKTYKNTPFDEETLTNNGVTVIHEGSNNNLWIGTYNGLNKYSYKTDSFTQYRHDKEDNNSISSDVINEILTDKSGRLWLATENGIDIYDEENDKFTHYRNDPNDKNTISCNSVYSLYQDSNGIFWIGTEKGLNRYNPKTGKIKKFFSNPLDKDTLSNNVIYQIYEDSTNTLWIGTRNGLNKFNRKTEKFRRYKNDPNDKNSIKANKIQAIYEDTNNNLWIGTDGGGLNKYDRKNDGFISYLHNANDSHSIINNDVLEIKEDSSGIIWVGTYGGISKFNPNPEFSHYKTEKNKENTLNDNMIFSLYEDKENILWIGTSNGGLNRFNRSTGEFKYYTYDKSDSNTLSSNKVTHIFKDSSNTLWVATDRGLNKFNKEKENFKRYLHNKNDKSTIVDNRVKYIFEDSKKNLWIATREGLDKFNKDKETFTHYGEGKEPFGLSDDYVRYIYEDTKGNLWLGTVFGGLNKFNKETEKFTHYENDPEDSNTISHNSIKCIHEDDNGYLWIATNNGLNRFNPKDESFKLYTEDNGLSNNYIYGILEDENNNLWLSTNNGLSKFNKKREEFKNYGVSNGLQNKEFNVNAFYKSNTGEMFFGGVNGFNSFFPKDIEQRQNKPQINISSINVLGKEINLKNKINLEYTDDYISFNFVALDYLNPKKNRYAYKLEGFDKEWKYSGTRHYASYTNLEGGDYVFKVKGSNSNGIWSEDIAKVNISIEKPPWKRWWAFALYFLIFILLMYLVFNYVNILENKVKERTYELDNTNKELLNEIKERRKIEGELKEKLNENKQLYEKIVKDEEFQRNFFVTLSHELKTPINVILGAIQLINLQAKSKTDKATDRIKKHTKVIKRNSYRLLKTVNNLIDSTKIKSGDFKLSIEKKDIVYLVRDIVDSMKGYIEQEKLKIYFNSNVDKKIIDCDIVEIERIVLNIISNAIKFTPEGGAIWVDMKDQKDSIKISIKDNGIGIPKEKQKAIFERFKQSDNDLTRSHQGSGIGLSLVKSLVEMHGGSIEINSEVNKGSEFIITLPTKNDKYKTQEYDTKGILKNKGNNIKNIEIELSDLSTNE
ncbi:MAG: histidine kinase [Firmicutes bacterium]|nr:histidine kinase [Bacillota bacterium]